MFTVDALIKQLRPVCLVQVNSFTDYLLTVMNERRESCWIKETSRPIRWQSLYIVVHDHIWAL